MLGLIRMVRYSCSLGLIALWIAGVGYNSVDATDRPYVPPPPAGYDPWNDKLIGQKMAQLFGGDPNPYVTGGAFYDVGRNPTPKRGFPQTSYGDYRFRVTHIKFDWKNNQTTVTDPITGATTTATSYDEAQTIQYAYSNQLAHVSDGKAKGEWIYKYNTFDADAGRSEPALYVTSKAVKVQVRVECAAPLHYAYIGAKELRDPQPHGTPNGSYPTKWRDVTKTKVDFVEKISGQVWVSKGAQTGTDPQGNPIYSEYVELPLSANTKAEVDRSDIIWQWYADKVSATGLAQDEWTAATVSTGGEDGWETNKSGEYVTQTIIDALGDPQTVEVVLPHRFYTVLDRPKYPWYDAADQSDQEAYGGNRKPWVVALDFAIADAGKVELRGETMLSSVAAKVTNFCYKGYSLEYSHIGAPAGYVYCGGNAITAFATVHVFVFLFSNWLVGFPYTKSINCHDQALAVTTLTALIGGDANYTTMEPFGYVTPSDFVGTNPRGDNCNNPFFEIAGVFVVDGLVGADDTCWRTTALNERKRSIFNVHAWMEMSNLVFDATAGAANSNSPRMGISRAAFKTAAIDLSHTAVAPWEDNEEMAAKLDASGRFIAPAKNPGPPPTDDPDPNYKNGDMDKAGSRTFSIQ